MARCLLADTRPFRAVSSLLDSICLRGLCCQRNFLETFYRGSGPCFHRSLCPWTSYDSQGSRAVYGLYGQGREPGSQCHGKPKLPGKASVRKVIPGRQEPPRIEEMNRCGRFISRVILTNVNGHPWLSSRILAHRRTLQ